MSHRSQDLCGVVFYLVNAIGSFLNHLILDRTDNWYPIMGVYYLTYACPFRCQHCSDGSGIPYHRLKSPILSASRVHELFRILRGECDYLVITGGEPLQHPEFAKVMEEIVKFRFRGVVLTTNGYELEPVLPVVAKSVDHLVFSLQTMDSAKADSWYGYKEGVQKRVLENLDRAASFPGRKYEMIISSVVTPQNIQDLYGVYDYARKNGFRLAACPQLNGVKAHEELVENKEYRQFYDFLIAEKRNGGLIQGTVDYLEYMRDLKKFRCHPFTMVTVSPTGDVFYPCLEIGRVAGNLFTEPNLHRIRLAGHKAHGPQPVCGTQCHSACALGFSRLLENPLSVMHEGFLVARSRLNKLCQGEQVSSSDSSPAD